jgi:hypothetical protein
MQAPNLLPEELRKKEEELEKIKNKPETEEIKLSAPDKLNIPIENNKNTIGFFDRIKSFFSKKSEQKMKDIKIKSIDERIKLKNKENFREKASLLASAPLLKTSYQKIRHNFSEVPKK